MSTFKELAGSVQTLEANGGAISNGAAGAADDANLDNTTELAFAYDFELNAGFGSSVTAGEDVDLYLVPVLDGTNEADKDTSTPKFQDSHYRGTFITANTGTTARRMTIEGVPVGPYAYKAYLVNKSGQTVSATWTLKAFPVKSQSA